MSSAQAPGSHHALEKSRYISSASALRDWQFTTSCLLDECAAYARLASYASTMAIVVPGSNNWARLTSLEMQLRATQLLQRLINGRARLDEQSRSALLPALLGLFRTECINSNVAAAAQHGRVIRLLFEKGHFTIQLLIQALCMDVDLAAKKIHRTFFDVDDWVVKVTSPTLTAIENILPSLKVIPLTLHPSIMLPLLHELWQMEHFIAVSSYVEAFPSQYWPERSAGDMAFIYLAIHAFIDCGRLINLYMDLKSGQDYDFLSQAQRRLQAALTIGLLYGSRRVGHECAIGGVDVRDASDGLMRELRYSLELMWEEPTTDVELEPTLRAEAIIWLLYQGSVFEQRKVESELYPDLWFIPRLRQWALKHGVMSWTRMRALATHFMYTPIISPDGSSWFDGLLAGPKVVSFET
jgi:hypothetical protein